MPAGWETVNLKAPFVAPRMFSEVCTVTTSPGVNGFDGRKLPPLPSESPSIVPE
jgi:hypothetical protein